MKRIISILFICLLFCGVLAPKNVDAAAGNPIDDQGNPIAAGLYSYWVDENDGPAMTQEYEYEFPETSEKLAGVKVNLKKIVGKENRVGVIKEYYSQDIYIYDDGSQRAGEAKIINSKKIIKFDSDILLIPCISQTNNNIIKVSVDGVELKDNKSPSFDDNNEGNIEAYYFVSSNQDGAGGIGSVWWKTLHIRFTSNSLPEAMKLGNHIVTIEWESGYKEDQEYEVVIPNLEWDYVYNNEKNITEWFWYENGIKQGASGDPKNIKDEKYGNIERGREIFDPASNGWYWLDANADGAKASNKEVWMPYIYQDEAKWDDEQRKTEAEQSNVYTESETTALMSEQILRAIENKEGKWVRYDAQGKMYKGWVTLENWQEKPEQNGNTYYYDYRTGLMAKGETVIDGVTYFFDPITGVLQK